MRLGRRLALDPGEEGVRAREDEDECKGRVRVGPGWMGTPGEEDHPLQSGFYANIKNENGSDGGGDGVWGANRWPRLKDEKTEIDGSSRDFEECFTSAAELMHHVALSTLDLAQKAAVEVMDDSVSNKTGDGGSSKTASEILPDLRKMAEESDFLPARLVYYDANFSREDTIMKGGTNGDDGHKYWLPWHVDFNLATAFAPAMWIDEAAALEGHEDEFSPERASSTTCSGGNPEHGAGLLLRNPDGKVVPAALDDDCILIQLGAHSQLATGGILRAGPHAVGKGKVSTEGDGAEGYKFGRLSFGLFVYGPWTAKMKPSEEMLKMMDSDEVLKDDFGCLMEKAYTGDTVLEGYRKFESYMNGL